ncbi:hypothetical protein CCHR01_13759 [Colletotrichum chrysophilum]|uniref:Uncharacterized protein n=1 Tax=Colletotrichum chrysophilum TaxID=1836956 RepID=A0AAD9A9K0_9PEZI|nr:hypothetical protein CCHR01_13759 [Colletotrichum chrysophilum]
MAKLPWVGCPTTRGTSWECPGAEQSMGRLAARVLCPVKSIRSICESVFMPVFRSQRRHQPTARCCVRRAAYQEPKALVVSTQISTLNSHLKRFIVTLRDLDLRYTLHVLIALRYCFCFPTLATDVCGNLREIVSAPVLLCARSELAKEIPPCDPTPHPSQRGIHPVPLLLLPNLEARLRHICSHPEANTQQAAAGFQARRSPLITIIGPSFVILLETVGSDSRNASAIRALPFRLPPSKLTASARPLLQV